MPSKTVQLSVRVSDEDALFLSELDVEGAVTPSEKLRAILHEARRRHEGLKDPSEGGLMLRDMSAAGHRNVRNLEGKFGSKSDLILKLYERIPDIMAKLISGPDGKIKQDSLSIFENELTEQIGVLLRDFVTLGITSPARVYSEENFRRELAPIIELVELLQHFQKTRKGDEHA